jgi:hypothetical protein
MQVTTIFWEVRDAELLQAPQAVQLIHTGGAHPSYLQLLIQER